MRETKSFEISSEDAANEVTPGLRQKVSDTSRLRRRIKETSIQAFLWIETLDALHRRLQVRRFSLCRGIARAGDLRQGFKPSP